MANAPGNDAGQSDFRVLKAHNPGGWRPWVFGRAFFGFDGWPKFNPARLPDAKRAMKHICTIITDALFGDGACKDTIHRAQNRIGGPE